ncbi:polysaccharide biosynthesis/export family protein [Oecophyllibacter saccharovorans]|uniref:polysaccharide biosynthesis/export family protein n=1 Tax=Oecophyllibacter saccharovorans TaxID=2558360 RepID=UPI00143DDCF3|nr:polysaccharide biosynthesis/export family protein [Oecophyllibacter saccharovorans]
MPDSGPTASHILKVYKNPKKNLVGFGMVDLSPDLLTLMAMERPAPFAALQGSRYQSGNDAIGPGDTLQISIYEMGNGLFGGGGTNASGRAEASGMLGGAANSSSSLGILSSASPPAEHTGSTATLTNLPPMVVSHQGTITLPYVGTFKVAGRMPEQVASQIQSALSRKSQAPQVLVRLVDGVSNSAIVYGEVKRPGRVALTPNHESLLDVVALAQGTLYPSEDLMLRLTRGRHIIQVPMSLIEHYPSQNIQIRPGDRLEVYYQPRTFTVFGAAGKVSEVPFKVPQLSLTEAIARVGGPNNSWANPRAVYLLRFEDNHLVRRLGLRASDTAPVTPILYRINMMNPGSYFLGQKFAMKNKDMLYFSNAPADEFYKLFGLISTIIQPGITAGMMAR